MALLLTNKPGTITTINVPEYSGVGILRVYGLPQTAAIVTTGFDLTVSARHSIAYSISNTKYIYIYGTSLTTLNVSFMLFPFINCQPSYSLLSFLSFLDGYIVSAVGAPRITVSVGGALWRGVIIESRIRAGDSALSPEIAIAQIQALGNFA